MEPKVEIYCNENAIWIQNPDMLVRYELAAMVQYVSSYNMVRHASQPLFYLLPMPVVVVVLNSLDAQ